MVGEVGRVLNYDEIVLYNHAGALPRYLVVYAIDDNPAYNTHREYEGAEGEELHWPEDRLFDEVP